MKFPKLILLFAVIMILKPSIASDSDLYYVTREPKVKSGRPPIFIMLHGYGSNEQDLFSLATYIPDSFLVVSVRAPLQINKDGYAWFNIPQTHGKIIIDETQAEKSRLLLIEFIEKIQAKFQFDEKRIYLCGFSQGSAMAYSVGLTQPQKIKGLAILSGRVLPQTRTLVTPGKALSELHIFIGHGKQDDVIPIEYARDSRAYLQSIGLEPIYKEYKEGHNTTDTEIEEMVVWLTGH